MFYLYCIAELAVVIICKTDARFYIMHIGILLDFVTFTVLLNFL